MNLLSRLVDGIFDSSDSSTNAATEAYLAEAVDLHDLERRMRALDQRRSFGPFGQNA
jgi:hypothetical protein